MSSEPTSALTFGDLVLEVARKAGMAYHGDDGTEPAQAPVDAHDLAECKRHVNNALRMFVADAPKTGWRWTRPSYGLTMWASVAVAAARTVTGGTYDPTNDQTLLTANSDVFYDTMEEKAITVTGRGTFVIKQYVSATSVYVYGSHFFSSASTYSIESNGNFTLPRDFVGTYTGGLTYQANTNQGSPIEWTSETVIRQLRENSDETLGWPTSLAVRPRLAVSGRRRYEAMAWPTPDETAVADMTYDLNFNEMVSLTEVPPTPIVHDETLRAAALAVVERDVDDAEGSYTARYQTVCLPNSHAADARSGPRKLGYFGNRRPMIGLGNFRDLMRRPNVTFNP